MNSWINNHIIIVQQTSLSDVFRNWDFYLFFLIDVVWCNKDCLCLPHYLTYIHLVKTCSKLFALTYWPDVHLTYTCYI